MRWDHGRWQPDSRFIRERSKHFLVTERPRCAILTRGAVISYLPQPKREVVIAIQKGYILEKLWSRKKITKKAHAGRGPETRWEMSVDCANKRYMGCRVRARGPQRFVGRASSRGAIANLCDQLALLLAFSASVLCLATARGEELARKKVSLGSPITHSDWMLHNPAPVWGPQGVRQILDRCKACGWKRVYWRCFDGGRACYGSRLMEPLHGFDEDNYTCGRDSAWVIDKLKLYDWGRFDAFKEAVAYGHQIGLEVHAWLSINEDDHGWGLASRFTRENPDSRWVRRDGRPFRSQQSFAFPKVREYKLALLREILAYGPDGIFFDWIRTGDVRDNPQTDPDGVAIYGYERPNLDPFRAKYGVDPHTVPNSDDRWVRVRAEPQTLFMRDAHALIRQQSRRVAIAVMVHNPWGYRGSPTDTPYKDNLRGLLLDTPTWAKEGLMDEIVAAGYYRPGGNAEAAYRAARQETGGGIPVWLFGWLGSREQFLADVQLAERIGAPQLLLWESDYIGLPPANEAVVKAMSDYAGK